mgnify:FL=1|tara:strand:- start:105 stop:239 length:135 start_codon:yes stop_codon:yes gene_type:complete
MNESAELVFAIFVFLGFGFLVNWMSEAAYWAWHDWKSKRSDKDK